MVVDIANVNFELDERIRDHYKGKFDENRRIMTPYGELGEIMYHIFDDVNFWVNNITGVTEELRAYAELTTEKEFFDEWNKVDKRLLDYFEKNKNSINYKQKISLKFGSGREWHITIEDCLMHMSHHSFYHRGILGAAVRMTNKEPLPSSNWLDIVITNIKNGTYDED